MPEWSREEEFAGERMAGEHAPENIGRAPESGPGPLGERICQRCGRMLLTHRKRDECPVQPLRRSA